MGGTPHPLVAIVDDDESLCRALGRYLSASGIPSVTFSDAESFLADRERARFDCLVLDIQLGGMSGIELNQRLAGSGSKTPVIFMTAHDSPEVRELAIRTGCAAYLQKTDSGETVLAAIHQATRWPHEQSTRVD